MLKKGYIMKKTLQHTKQQVLQTVKSKDFWMHMLPIFVFGVLFTLIPHEALAKGGTIEFGWTQPLERIKEQLTGPVARILGILGIVICAIGLLAGNAGDGMKKFLVIILALSIISFATSFVEYIL